MKKSSIRSSILLISIALCEINAQEFVYHRMFRDVSKMRTIDSGNVRIWYALNATDVKNPDTYDDFQRLEIGKQFSLYYSYFSFQSDSLCTAKRTGAPTRCFLRIGKKSHNWSEYYYTDYLKDFNENNLTEFTYMPVNIPNSQFTEVIPVQLWKMHDETAYIDGYLTQKATCRFRGRNFTAWFATEIPINNGPWKFSGLPGLILKVYDDEKLFTFEAVKIEFHDVPFPIKMHEINNNFQSQTNFLIYRKLMSDIWEDYFRIAGFTRSGDGPPLPSNPKGSYQPLELEK